MKKLLGTGALILVLLILGFWAYKWVSFRISHAVSNAVFVESDSFVRVAFDKVGGRVEVLYKEEGELVRKGDPLAKLDDRDLKLKLASLKASLERMDKEIEALKVKRETLREELRVQRDAIRSEKEALEEKIGSLEVRAGKLRKDLERFRRLHAKGVIPLTRVEELETSLKEVLSQIDALEKQAEALEDRKKAIEVKEKGLRELDLKIEALKKGRKSLEAKFEELNVLLAKTLLRSPVEGVVAKRYVKEGEVVRPGQFIYALYDPKDLYILVLLEETKLKGVNEGNRVKIKIDAFPKEKFEGVVESISPAAASKFALIPRDITAGEFTKVAQRIEVRVKITEGPVHLMRVGM